MAISMAFPIEALYLASLSPCQAEQNEASRKLSAIIVNRMPLTPLALTGLFVLYDTGSTIVNREY